MQVHLPDMGKTQIFKDILWNSFLLYPGVSNINLTSHNPRKQMTFLLKLGTEIKAQQF